jgi:hypothetical protein
LPALNPGQLALGDLAGALMRQALQRADFLRNLVAGKPVFGGSVNYESACRTLEGTRRLRERIGEVKQHASYLADLMDRHNAKRNFMKLLTAARP